MFDIFSGMFDLDNDKELDVSERVLECSFIEDIYDDDGDDDDDEDEEDEDYDDDEDDEDEDDYGE